MLSVVKNAGAVEECYKRTSGRNGVGWTNWERLGNFGANSISDLASLLGALQSYNYNETSTDANTLEHGMYRCANFTNTPQANGFVICLAPKVTVTSVRMQFFTIASGAETYVRSGTPSSWGSWSRCDSFGQSTAAGLASLLGAVQSLGVYADADSVTQTSIAYCSSPSTVANNPTGERYGILVTINNGNVGYNRLQFFFSRSSGAFYWRTKLHNEEWSAQTWYKIQGTAI